MTVAPKESSENLPILIAAFAMIFLAFGMPTYSLQFIYGPAMEEFGWSNAEVNLLSTAKFLIGAVAALGVGILIDKIGGRWAVLSGALASGLAMALFLFATNLAMYYLAGAMLGLSAASIVAAAKVIVTRLYRVRQGVAIGIVLSATSSAGIVMPWIWPPLLEFMNWRQVMALLSVAPVVIGIPLWLALVAISPRARAVVDAPAIVDPTLNVWTHFRAISSDRKFWLMAAGVFLVSGVDQALMQNTVLFLRGDKGLSIGTTIAWAVSLIGVVSVFGKVGSGWFYDRYSIRGVMYFYILLAFSVFAGLAIMGTTSLLLFVLLRGVAHGGMIVDVPVLVRHYFGMERIGLTIGIMSVCVNLGFAAGPPALGWLADVSGGSFSVGFFVYGCVALLATLTLASIKPRHWLSLTERKKMLDAPRFSSITNEVAL
jgi:MFS transporter, OFA family, oxalate/formate antiporter